MTEKKETKNRIPSYVSKDMAIIIPTKDRPDVVRRLLQSIAELDCKVGRIIIIASGQGISDVVELFSKTLTIEYYTSEPGHLAL